MGWYHYEMANGNDPSATENTNGTGTCNSSSNSNGGTVHCPDGTCSITTKTATGTTTKSTECSSNNTTTVATTIDTTTTSNNSSNNKEESIKDSNNNTATLTNTTTPDNTTTTTTTTTTNYTMDQSYEPEIYRDNGPIYHLCDEANWLSAIRIQRAYYPPTYWRDGKFTRGCCQRESLVATGNEYYKISSGRWIALEMDATKLHDAGITVECHRAPESTRDEPIQCLKIYSGITTTIPGFITNIYKMHRTADGTFTGMSLDVANTIPKVAPQKSLKTNTTTTATKEETAPATKGKGNNTKSNSSKEISSGNKSSSITKKTTSHDDNDTKKRSGLLWMRMNRRKSNQ